MKRRMPGAPLWVPVTWPSRIHPRAPRASFVPNIISVYAAMASTPPPASSYAIPPIPYLPPPSGGHRPRGSFGSSFSLGPPTCLSYNRTEPRKAPHSSLHDLYPVNEGGAHRRRGTHRTRSQHNRSADRRYLAPLVSSARAPHGQWRKYVPDIGFPLGIQRQETNR